MFNFIKQNVNHLYDTISAARVSASHYREIVLILNQVAVFHSTPSRDYVDIGEGNGLFCSMGPPASLRARNRTEWYSDNGGAQVNR